MHGDRYCSDCDSDRSVHIASWIEALIAPLLPRIPISFSAEQIANKAITKLLLALRLATWATDYEIEQLPARSAVFVRAARTRGVQCAVLRIGNTLTEHLKLALDGYSYYIFGYPTASHFDNRSALHTSNKESAKTLLKNAGFPVANGSAYSCMQRKRAITDSLKNLRLPLVVKPICGTFSRHVTTNIRDEATLKKAIAWARNYQPRFLVEEQVPGLVHRFTVIDFKTVAAARQEPPETIGDGTLTVMELIENENKRRREIRSRDPHSFLHEIPAPELPLRDRVPAFGERVQVHKDPFMRLGATIVDETAIAHPVNIVLAEQIARAFGIHCAGIDIILEDCSRPWHEQSCAILEINNLPSIEMHAGNRVANALVDLFFKHYRGC